jgi:signal transduction histidine kinase
MNHSGLKSKFLLIASLLFAIIFAAYPNPQPDSLIQQGKLQLSHKQYSPAKATFLKAIKHYTQLGDNNALISVMNSIALLEEAIQQPDSAMRYYRLGLSLVTSRNDSIASLDLMLNCANRLMQLNKYTEARSLLRKALHISDTQGLLDKQVRGRRLQAELLYKQANYKDAYNHLSRSARFSDSIAQLKNQHLLDSILAKYDSEIKNCKTTINPQPGISKSFNSGTLCFLLILSILIGALAMLFYMRNKNKQKLAMLLEETTRHIDNREDDQKAMNTTRDKFYAIIAQDLRNPFTAILGFADILKEEYTTLGEKEKILYIRAIHSASFNIYELLKNLHDWSRAQSGTMEAKPTPIDLAEMAEQHIQLFTSYAQNKDIQLSIESQGKPIVFADRNMVSAIIRNLLNNAIKFTNKGGEVHVNILASDNKVELSVTDIGLGISEENLRKLFTSPETFRSKGTADESGTGLGLILCKKFVTMNNGTIRAESAPGKGSRFTITLPAHLQDES